MILRKNILVAATVSLFLISFNANAAFEWVSGDVSIVADYGGYSSANYQVLIELADVKNQQGNAYTGACTSPFRVKVNVNGVTEEIKNRIFSLTLSAHIANKPISLYVDNSNAPYCTVQIGRIGRLLWVQK